MKKRLVVFTGAGVSAESGVSTFRDSGGLWEGHRIEDVATPEAWRRDREKVLRFYNERRRQLLTVVPNLGHYTIVALERCFDVTVITQNVDDLHERAGSATTIHLHGELRKARSTLDPTLVYSIPGPELNIGDQCERGSQLRPHIVWFGEAVPMYEFAAQVMRQADAVLVVGTSLVVYPAAGLLDEISGDLPVYYVDPKPAPLLRDSLTVIAELSSTGVEKAKGLLIERFVDSVG